MSDQPVRTIVETEEGDLAFQEYFVHRRCEPSVKGFRFEGADSAEAAPGARAAIRSADVIVICPSNPWVSVLPILVTLGSLSWPHREQGWSAGKKVIAVSPIVGGQAIKGPAAKMYRELGIEPSALAVANHYRGLATGFVLDTIDAQLNESVRGLNMRTLVTNTLMKSHDNRQQLANEVLKFIGDLP
jgi:LPPG:FO 2-phospho-L-lactate transferase